MIEIRRLVGDLTKKYLTPDFLTKAREYYVTGIENTLRAGRASGLARQGLSPEENRLADEFEVHYLDGQNPNMTEEEDQKLTEFISIQFPGSKEAFEKRERLYDEAYQPLARNFAGK